ncbi:MAG: glucokinase [Polaromonas sp.]
MNSNSSRLLGDIGGTNARFGWQRAPHQPIEHCRSLLCSDYPSLEAAIRAYLRDIGQKSPAHCAIGIANPITGDEVRMTNHDWSFSISALRAALHLERLVVVNDFTALALSLPTLPREFVRQVGRGQAVAESAIALTGPGTGLGVSGLLPTTRAGTWSPISGEGGHATLAAEGEIEHRVLSALRHRHGHVSAERVVSGPGLVETYRVLLNLKRRSQPRHEVLGDAAAVVASALRRDDPQAMEALNLFCGFLGSVAGNLALTIGARGGVYIGGGIVPRLGRWFDDSAFRRRFEGKGRFEGYLSAIPTFVIDAPTSPALQGAANALDD